MTGGSRGIGAATAIRLGRAGWTVLVNYREDAAAASEVCDAIAEEGGTAEMVRADVATEVGIEAVFDAADELGTLTALVNNAGIADEIGSVDTFSFARVDRLVRLNLTAVIVCCREAVQRMAHKHGGSGGGIVNLSSAAAKLGGAGQLTDYAATKGAIDTLTVGLALEWAGEGVRVNAVRPGIIATDIHASMGAPDRALKTGPSVPLGRAGTAEEVAEAIHFLLSDAASYTTGAILDVSGGRSAVP
ncbi:MAG: SDR family oxidoreductase [Pseudomonadota bacterium]